MPLYAPPPSGSYVTLTGAQTISGAKTFNAGDLLDAGERYFDVKAYGATGNGSTDDTAAINSAIAAATSGGVIFFPPGTYKVTSSGRTDAGVTYSAGTWTDSHITSGDVGSYVLGSSTTYSSAGLIPKIATVNSGVSFTTDVNPIGTVPTSITIVKPAIVLPPGIQLQGAGSDYNSQSSPSPTSLLNDVGTGGITVFMRGTGGNSDRYGIFDLGIHGANTGTSTTLYGIFTGNQVWFVDIVRCSVSYHGFANIALDANINNINIQSCMFIDGGYAAATVPTGGIIFHPYWGQPSSGVQIRGCFFVSCYGFGIADGDADGAYGVVITDTQFNGIQATSATNSGTSMVLQSHPATQNGESTVIGGWSETAATYDLYTSGDVVVIGMQMYSNTAYHWYVNGGTVSAIGVYFGQATSYSMNLQSSGNVNWSSVQTDNTVLYNNVPSIGGVLPSFGSSGTGANGGSFEAAGTIMLQTGLPSTGTAALGGYYDGLGIGGVGNAGTGNPMFGVLAKNQSGNGLGNTAFTVIENNAVYTYHNTLDDGSGNMGVYDGGNIVLGTTTGTQIGTGTSQKLGFYGTSAKVQQSGDVATALQSLGLVASATYTLTGQLFLSAAGMWPSNTNGSATPAIYESPTNNMDVYYLSFSHNVSNPTYAQATVAMPTNWNASTITAKFYWMANDTSGHAVVWGLQSYAYATGITLDETWPAAVTAAASSDSATTPYQVIISAATGNITVGGTPAAGDLVQFRIQRASNNGSDTLTTNALLLGVMITYTY